MLQIPTKKAGVIQVLEDEMTKKISLDTCDASKMTIISSQLSQE
jgi:hypothetical protein